MGLIDFVTCFLSIVKHREEKQVYLVSGLIDLFTEITDYNGTRDVHWDHFTNFLIENVIEAQIGSNIIPSKYMSKMTAEKFESLYKSPHVVEFTPVVVGGNDLCLRRIAPS